MSGFSVAVTSRACRMGAWFTTSSRWSNLFSKAATCSKLATQFSSIDSLDPSLAMACIRSPSRRDNSALTVEEWGGTWGGTPFMFLYLSRVLRSPAFHDPRFSYLFGPPH